MHLDAVPLDAVVGAALLHLGPRSTQINVEVPDDLPMVRADAGLLERVVVNLLPTPRQQARQTSRSRCQSRSLPIR